MAPSTTPARVPERQPDPRPISTEKKPARFVIKIGGVIPA